MLVLIILAGVFTLLGGLNLRKYIFSSIHKFEYFSMMFQILLSAFLWLIVKGVIVLSFLNL